ncbi:Dockerin type I repeat protein [Rubripirellula amarantea]|uniref:Dockerin type I repeat protein n=1 Tax=Rubripirellula amarantea TaxID=2527999 RepID=A0A5C5WK20_9BACT|nr:tandem-95 repeat protein [Rubripirellula amarantea]TWT51164.1 Dockerin type I repeat protein [Rubripirellula amarantea]
MPRSTSRRSSIGKPFAHKPNRQVRRRMMFESLEQKRLFAGDVGTGGLVFETPPSQAEAVGELLELQLDVTRDGTSLLDSNRAFTANVGDRFDFEIRYDDLRVFDDRLGAYSVYADISSSIENAPVEPLLTETQFLFIDDPGSGGSSSEILISMDGRGSSTIAYDDFAGDAVDALGNALQGLGFDSSEFSVEQVSTSVADLAYQIRFLGEDFYNVDVPPLSVDLIGFGVDADSSVDEVPARLADGSVNSDAIQYNLITANPTFNNSEDFYKFVNEGAYNSTDFLVGLGGLGLADTSGLGIPGLSDDGVFVEPFFVVGLPVEVVATGVDVEFEVGPSSTASSILLYGESEALASDFILLDEDAVVTGTFVASHPIAQNPVLREDVNDDGTISLADALAVTNQLPAIGTVGSPFAAPYLDVDGDGSVTPLDANRVMTALDALDNGEPIDEFVTSDAPSLLALGLDARKDGVSVLDGGNSGMLQVGDIFELEVFYEDLRAESDRSGAFSLFVDITASQPDKFRPVVSETQQIFFSEEIRSASGGSIEVALQGESGTVQVSLADIQISPSDALSTALESLGFGPDRVEVTRIDMRGADAIGLQLRFTDKMVDIPNVTIDTSGLTGASVVADVVETAAFLSDGETVNPAAIEFNINSFSRTLNGGTEFYSPMQGATYSLDEGSLFQSIGGVGGLSTGEGIRGFSSDGTLVQPFAAFSIELEVIADADDVEFEVGRAASPDHPIALYGLDNALGPNQVIGGNYERITLDFQASESDLVAGNESLTLVEDAFAGIDLSTLVTGGIPDTYAIEVEPESGFTLLNGSSVQYYPNSNFFGSDSFVYRVSNASGSATGVISLTVSPVNDTPVAIDDAVSTTPDTELTISGSSLTANDSAGPNEDDQTLTVVGVGESAAGATVTLEDGDITYVPATGFNGTDTFTYEVSDGVLQSTATVVVSVGNGELIELQLDVTRDGTSLLDEDRNFSAKVGDRFNFEIYYDDLRVLDEEIGAFAIFADIMSSAEAPLKPLMTETQLLSIGSEVADESTEESELLFSMEGRTGVSIAYSDFSDDKVGSLESAFVAMGFEVDEFSVTEYETSSGNLNFRIRFLGDSFIDQDVPPLTVEFISFLADVSTETTQIDVRNSDGSINSDAVRFNLVLESPTFNQGEAFYADLTEGSYSETTFLTRLGGIGPVVSDGGGVPSLSNDGVFIQPFFVLALPFEVTGISEAIEFEVKANEGDESVLLYGRDSLVTPELVFTDRDAIVTGTFTAGLHNAVLREDVNGDGMVSALDAIQVMNLLPLIDSQGPYVGVLYPDVDADGEVTAIDVNRIMTAMAALEAGEPIDDFVTSDADGLLALSLDAKIGGDSILDGDGRATLRPGQYFELEVQYEDLRSEDDRLGAFSLFADIATSHPETFRPVFSEHQQVFFSSDIAQTDGGVIRFSTEEGVATAEVSHQDFVESPLAAITDAAYELFGPTAVSVSQIRILDSDVLGFRLQFSGDYDAPNVNVDVSELTGAAVEVSVVEVPGRLEDGSLNPAAFAHSLTVTPWSTDNQVSFYQPFLQGASYDPDSNDVFRNIGGVGALVGDGGGIPSLIQDELPQPFTSFTITLEVLQNADDVVFEIGRSNGDSPTLLYGLDNPLGESQVIAGANARIVLDFVTPEVVVADDVTITQLEDNFSGIDLATLVSSGEATLFDTVGSPQNGTVFLEGSLLRYFPLENFFGTDSIEYVASDGVTSSSATITFEVQPVNDPPISMDDDISGLEDTEILVSIEQLLANDNDGDGAGQTLSITEVGETTSGATVEIDGDNIRYIPLANFAGSDSFTYTVSDSETTARGTVNVFIESVNDPPVANDDELQTKSGTTVDVSIETLLSNDSPGPLEDQTLALTNVEASDSGAVVVIDGDRVFYTSASGFVGTDTFTYTLSDGDLEVTGTVTVAVESAAEPVSLFFEGETAYDLIIRPNGDDLEVYQVSTEDIVFSRSIELVESLSISVDNGLSNSIRIENQSRLPFAIHVEVNGDGDDSLVVAEGTVSVVTLDTGDAESLSGPLTLTLGEGYEPLSASGFERVAVEEIDEILIASNLAIGDGELILNSSDPVELPAVTSIEGGSLSSTAAVLVGDESSIVGNGTVSTMDDSETPLTINGTVDGASADSRLTFTGFVNGNGSFSNVTFAGTFSPGLSATISDNGNVIYADTSNVIIELGGPIAGSGFDQVNHTGVAAVLGDVDVQLINDFQPSGGESYTIMTATDSLVNEIGELKLPELSQGLRWVVRETANTLRLEVEVDTGLLDGELVVDVVDGQLVVKTANGDPVPVSGNRLRLQVRPTDQFVNVAGFENSGTEVVDGVFVQKVSLGDVELEIAGSGWTNYINPADVDGSGSITSLDALLIINNMLRAGLFTSENFDLIDPATLAEFPNAFYDVSGDGRGSALDALRVINRISVVVVDGEGEEVAPLAGVASSPGETDRAMENLAIDIRSETPTKIASFATDQANVDAAIASLFDDDDKEGSSIGDIAGLDTLGW